MRDSTTTPPKVKLLDQVRNVIRTKHYSILTEEAYVQWVKRFVLFHNKRHPVEMGEAEINAFLTHLAVRRNVASSTQNQALCALLFLYKEVLQKKIGSLDDLIWAKRPKRLPVVFTRDEVKAVLNSFAGVKWIIGQLLYGAGLRYLEALRLHVQDLDFNYNQITVRDAKGSKCLTCAFSQTETAKSSSKF
ncbi:tyrosine-type recombinase/integrase [candidate division KSB1 bacterium]|nr:tyrosine-type recombinase/integrase [candidate division KSB1 bacterium]NIR71969.1 tyrosine-type recombinase/integrase [candidate division KSB1 bacterium]NIS24967.1 tyrosine-type recombinase/integrase [candidate division KSB1 bacterium]NIT71887.1 tyrosine-type recombinase/integrase [candidate division KSB1 bacterium]NIU25618.1 tyrosine-type recombinase/integrase [candidate division KSB1 bacterium]